MKFWQKEEAAELLSVSECECPAELLHVLPLLQRTQVYNVSSSKTVPQWLSESKKREQKKNEEFRRRLELLQDFRFNAACQRIKISPDQQYIFASGYHPPQVCNQEHSRNMGLRTAAVVLEQKPTTEQGALSPPPLPCLGPP